MRRHDHQGPTLNCATELTLVLQESGKVRKATTPNPERSGSGIPFTLEDEYEAAMERQAEYEMENRRRWRDE